MMRKNDSSGTTNKRFGVIRFTIYTFAVLLNGIVAICTLLGKAACFVNPLDHILPSYLGLAFPYLVIANLLFLLFWIIKRKYYVALPILTLLVCYPETRRTFSIGHDVHAEGDTLSVMSYNVRCLNSSRLARKTIFSNSSKRSNPTFSASKSSAIVICRTT